MYFIYLIIESGVLFVYISFFIFLVYFYLFDMSVLSTKNRMECIIFHTVLYYCNVPSPSRYSRGVIFIAFLNTFEKLAAVS